MGGLSNENELFVDLEKFGPFSIRHVIFVSIESAPTDCQIFNRVEKMPSQVSRVHNLFILSVFR